MKITFYGHSCFLVEFGGKKLLFDPFISGNPIASEVKVNDISCDHILLSHAHQDHMADAESIANANGANIISSFEVVSWFGEKNIPGHPMNLGGKWTFDFGTVKMVHAAHSSMFPDGSFGGPSSGFVLWNDKECLYFAGDTAVTMDMKLIPMTCPAIDLAILPVGDNFTMGYEDAVIAADFVQCDQVVGCHYDSFGFIEIDHEKAKSAFAAKQKTLHLLNIGESKEF